MPIDVRDAIVDFARRHGADETLVGRVGPAVAEAATTAIQHGCRHHRAVRVRYAADISGGDLQVGFSDEAVAKGDGRELVYGTATDLGARSIAVCTDNFEVRDLPDSGVELWMRWTRPSDQARLERGTRAAV